MDEDNVVGKARHGLHFAPHQECILMRHQDPSVEGNLRPATRRKSRIVQRPSRLKGEQRSVFLQAAKQFMAAVGRGNMRSQGQPASAQSRQSHPGQPAQKALVKTVARVRSLLGSTLHPTRPAAGFVGGSEILLGEGFAPTQKFQHRLA